MANKGEGCSIVVPAYNSESYLPGLVEEIACVMPKLSDHFELILINDGSQDKTWVTIIQLSAAYPWVRGINLMRNYGQHNAVLCGIRAARYPILITMDDDLQHPPSEIEVLLEKLDEGYDVVYGVPQTEQHGLWRDLASQITKWALQAAMGTEVARHVSAFRVMRTQLRNAFDRYDSPNVSIDVLLSWATSRFAAVKVRHEPRRVGQSHYTFKKLLMHAFNMATGFSTWPLRIASLLGFALTLLGGLLFIFVIANYLIHGGGVPGFAFLASTLTIFSGAQMFAIGIIGEYLARMFYRTIDRPAYVQRESTPVRTIDRVSETSRG